MYHIFLKLRIKNVQRIFVFQEGLMEYALHRLIYIWSNRFIETFSFVSVLLTSSLCQIEIYCFNKFILLGKILKFKVMLKKSLLKSFLIIWHGRPQTGVDQLLKFDNFYILFYSIYIKSKLCCAVLMIYSTIWVNNLFILIKLKLPLADQINHFVIFLQ